MDCQRWPAYFAIAGFVTVALGCFVALRPGVVHPALGQAQPVAVDHARMAVAAAPVPTAKPKPQAAEASYYDQLRGRINWVQTRIGNDRLRTPDFHSRMLLAKSAAQRARLADVGLSYRDVYGIINAETSWVPRMGASKDGTPNLGIAQFEPATAKALGMTNPNDPVEAVHAAALHMKEAALWSADRIEGLKLSASDRAEKLREGVSIYYNLSTKGRNAWNGRNTAKLPRETQRHIENARIGAQEAAMLDTQLASL